MALRFYKLSQSPHAVFPMYLGGVPDKIKMLERPLPTWSQLAFRAVSSLGTDPLGKWRAFINRYQGVPVLYCESSEFQISIDPGSIPHGKRKVSLAQSGQLLWREKVWIGSDFLFPTLHALFSPCVWGFLPQFEKMKKTCYGWPVHG
jgi:hypothetical protein